MITLTYLLDDAVAEISRNYIFSDVIRCLISQNSVLRD
jgi:hypothetical protein